MKRMRIKSSKLAALLLLFTLPLASIPAFAANTQKPELVFVQGDNGDPTTATIITGQSIAIKETIPQGYVAQGITVTQKGDDQPIASGFDIPTPHQSITVSETFNPATGTNDNVDETLSAENIFALQGSYYAQLAEGNVYETNPATGDSGYGTVQSLNTNAIMEYSTCIIECTAAETATTNPNFTFRDGSGEGAFAKFNGGNTRVSVAEPPSKDPSKTKELKLNISNGNDSIDIVLTPQLIYANETEDMGTAEDTGKEVMGPDGKPVKKEQPDNYVRKGTTFELVFRMPQSEPLFLTVLTPQNAMEKVENQIRQSDGQSDTSFVVLEEGDSLDYITENFSLRSFSNQFNARFKVEWVWTPDAKQMYQGSEVEISSLPDEVQEQFRQVLQTGGGNQDMQRVTVNPMEDNVTGTLTATVSYYAPGGEYQTSATKQVPVKNVVVRGYGNPVEVTQVRQILGGSEGGETYFDDVTLPGSKVMDAYKGDVDSFQINPKGPYEYELQLNMGAKNGAAQYATITATGDTSVVSIKTQQGSEQPMDYQLGDQIQNKQFNVGDNTTPGKVSVILNAQRLPQDSGKRSVTLTFHFFIPDRNGKPVESSARYSIKLDVYDNTPSQDSSLKSLVIRDQNNKVIDFPFESDKFLYAGVDGTIHLPYKTDSITLTPTLNDSRGADTPIIITRQDATGATVGIPVEVKSGLTSEALKFDEPGKVISVFVKTPAQDPREEYTSTYQLDIVRDQPSTDDTLKSLGLYYADDTTLKNNLIKDFDPEVLEYNLEIPYSTQKLRVRAEKNDANDEGPVIKPELVGSNPNDPDKQWLDNLPDLFKASQNGIVDLTVTVTSEASATVGGDAGSGGSRTYTVRLRRADPAHDATLKTMEVLDKEEQKLTYTPSFKPDTDTYTMEIPYATSQIKLKLTPADTNVNNIKIYSVTENNLLYEMKKGEIKIGAATSPIDILPVNDEAIRKLGYHPIWIEVTAEDETTIQKYELRVTRAEPSTDALLKSLTVQDQNGSQLKMLAFHPDETSYSLTVPYETTGVSFTPTANYAGATIEILEKGGLIPSQVPSGNTSKVFQLEEAGKTKTFEITVTAEDGKTTKTYTMNFVRELPSSDARLKKLQVDNVDDFSPVFVSNKTSYDAIVSEGADGVVITPTADHPGATIRIILDADEDNASNSIVVPSGQASELIDIIKVEQDVQIEVTAQDGVTKMVYTIHFTNENLIEKTSNADLRRLEINYGLMTPNFKPAITEYEVTVPEDTYSVDILPKADDPLAEVHVFAGTKEIGDYDGYYAEALEDGENPITIEVTSPDETVTKTYTVNVYRNEEDKLKNLTPLEAEDIDFENSGDVILVMIDEYPRVSSSVFEELKNYPEKTIIFQGNDYSLEFKASDLERVIPQREIYDFRMSFTSPDEDIIYDHIWDYSRNDDIDNRIVMLYFEQHTSLPGPATLHVSLGSRYDNDTLYWHYYNQERDRIDYYGSLQSNSKGNIAVRIDHFSTYLISPKHRIAGSADKEGVIDELGQTTNGGDSLDQSGSKPFPNTGAGEGA